MSPGKAIAQAGHAYFAAGLGSLDTSAGATYARLNPGTKICLDGGSEADMMRLAQKLEAAGIQTFPIIDRDHVEPPHFDGSPILTAIGVGPIARTDVPSPLRKLKLYGKA